LKDDVLSSLALRDSATISDKNKQPISENRIQFRGHYTALASAPGFTMLGGISRYSPGM